MAVSTLITGRRYLDIRLLHFEVPDHRMACFLLERFAAFPDQSDEDEEDDWGKIDEEGEQLSVAGRLRNEDLVGGEGGGGVALHYQ